MTGEILGKREIVGKIKNVKVTFHGKSGTIEFWQSYPSFAPLGYQDFEIDTWVSEKQVEKAVQEWEEGAGISPQTFIDSRVIDYIKSRIRP